MAAEWKKYDGGVETLTLSCNGKMSIKLVVEWEKPIPTEKGRYSVYFNSHRLSKSFETMEEGKRAAMAVTYTVFSTILDQLKEVIFENFRKS